jgi:hypothetical protein
MNEVDRKPSDAKAAARLSWSRVLAAQKHFGADGWEQQDEPRVRRDALQMCRSKWRIEAMFLRAITFVAISTTRKVIWRQCRMPLEERPP